MKEFLILVVVLVVCCLFLAALEGLVKIFRKEDSLVCFAKKMDKAKDGKSVEFTKGEFGHLLDYWSKIQLV